MSDPLIELPGHWVLRRVNLDANGVDAYGWRWGPGLPLYHLSDDADSLTVRAPCPTAALVTVLREGWPPRIVKRFNWEYASP